MIPKHCIVKFEGQFKVYPCISEIRVPSKDLLKTMIKKSETIWYHSDENNDRPLIKEECLLYDTSGIYIYYKLIDEGVCDVYFLSVVNKRDNVEFDLHILKKQIKNYGNYGRTTETEN